MIGRMKNGRFLPLFYDRQSGKWSPLGRSRKDALTAGRDCLAHFQIDWREIESQARLLRALAEHPEFHFSGDGIDSAMVRNAAVLLSRRIESSNANILRLLDDATPKDEIAISSFTFHVIEQSGVLHAPAEFGVDSDESAMVRIAESILASAVTTRGLMHTIRILGDELAKDSPFALFEAMLLLADKLDSEMRTRLGTSLAHTKPTNGNSVITDEIEDAETGRIMADSRTPDTRSDSIGPNDENEDADPEDGNEGG